MDIDRKEEVRVNKQGQNVVTRQEIVHDRAYERKGLVQRFVQVIWLGVLALEILLGMRMLLKLLAANPAAPFASFVYRVSEVFLGPFRGLTVIPSANGVVLEIPTAIAMMVYLTVGVLAVRLLWTLFRPSRNLTVRTYREVGR